MKEGRLIIVFTGMDGTGKTTLARSLTTRLVCEGHRVSYVWCRWEPFLPRPFIHRWKRNLRKSATSYEDELQRMKAHKRRLLSNPLVRWIWWVVFSLEYGLQLLVKLQVRALMPHRILVGDRFFYDSVVDQALNLGELDDCIVRRMGSLWMRLCCPRPSLVIHLDCEEEVALARGGFKFLTQQDDHATPHRGTASSAPGEVVHSRGLAHA